MRRGEGEAGWLGEEVGSINVHMTKGQFELSSF